MREMFKLLVTLCFVSTLIGCEFQRRADEKFGDQHFKTAIALIELHKVRYGTYPKNLKDLKFIGGWDEMALISVAYKKIDNGYTLSVTRGWAGKPELQYLNEFWRGLGIIRSND